MPGIETVGTQLRARIADPELFDDATMRTKPLGDGISIIVGKLKSGGDAMKTQAYRFDADRWDEPKAQAWLDAHGVTLAKAADARAFTPEFFDELRALIHDLPEPIRSEILRRARGVAGAKSRWRYRDERMSAEAVSKALMRDVDAMTGDHRALALKAVGETARIFRAINDTEDELLLDAAARIADIASDDESEIVGIVKAYRNQVRSENVESFMTFNGIVGVNGVNVFKAGMRGEAESAEDVEQVIARSMSPIIDDDPMIDSIVVAVEKADEKRIVYGVVMRPDAFDLHRDKISADELEKTAHEYLVASRIIKRQHDGKPQTCDVVESFIVPTDYEIGSQKIVKGSWVMAVRVNDDALWSDVKAGKITAFSPGGMALRSPA